jgi:Uma2 family endonuclease
MPIALTETPVAPPPPQPPRKRWTRSECIALEASGLWDQQRLELVQGELISKMGKNRPHINTLTMVQGWLIQIFGLRFVNPEAPVDVAPEDNPTNEPEPDVIVLRKETSYFQSNPRPEDVALVVEVADSSLSFDLTVKARLYARAGISEYWVADVNTKRIYVHRNPGSGKYGSVVIYSEQEIVSPLTAPHAEFLVGTAFPQTTSDPSQLA